MIPSTMLITYPPFPSVVSISPTTGGAPGGTAVTITGTNFKAPATVTIGGVACTSVTVVNSTTITCTTGAHAAGAVSATVTTPGGQASGGTFTYIAVTPSTTTHDSGSGTFIIPIFNTLTIDVWGGGGASASFDTGGAKAGSAGAASTCSTLGMTANGGQPGSSLFGAGQPGGAGGTASGGNNSNGTGSAGGNAGTTAGTSFGGGASNGGGNVACPNSGGSGFGAGAQGSIPGGGGSGAHGNSTLMGAGSGGGGWCRSVYSAGQLTVGAGLAWSVGAGATAQTGNQATGGHGRNGRVRFTVA